MGFMLAVASRITCLITRSGNVPAQVASAIRPAQPTRHPTNSLRAGSYNN